jgi:hypothetical protein
MASLEDCQGPRPAGQKLDKPVATTARIEMGSCIGQGSPLGHHREEPTAATATVRVLPMTSLAARLPPSCFAF